MKLILPALAAALALASPIWAATPNKPAAHHVTHEAARTAWSAQDVTGTITIVDPAKRLVVVQTAGGVPFDLDVTRQTQIRNGAQRVSLSNLSQDVNQTVTVRFVPERRGDVASRIRIGS